MANFLEKIDINVRRNISFVILALLAANHIYFFKPILAKLINFPLIGMIDIGTGLGVLGLFSLWLFYKRRM